MAQLQRTSPPSSALGQRRFDTGDGDDRDEHGDPRDGLQVSLCLHGHRRPPPFRMAAIQRCSRDTFQYRFPAHSIRISYENRPFGGPGWRASVFASTGSLTNLTGAGPFTAQALRAQSNIPCSLRRTLTFRDKLWQDRHGPQAAIRASRNPGLAALCRRAFPGPRLFITDNSSSRRCSNTGGDALSDSPGACHGERNRPTIDAGPHMPEYSGSLEIEMVGDDGIEPPTPSV